MVGRSQPNTRSFTGCGWRGARALSPAARSGPARRRPGAGSLALTECGTRVSSHPA